MKQIPITPPLYWVPTVCDDYLNSISPWMMLVVALFISVGAFRVVAIWPLYFAKGCAWWYRLFMQAYRGEIHWR